MTGQPEPSEPLPVETMPQTPVAPVTDGASVPSETTTEPAAAEETTEEAPLTPAVPTFGVVRVEPNGDAVIAGSSRPESEVKLFAGVSEIAKETTAKTGDFVIVTEDPLPTGGVELRLFNATDGLAGAESVVVLVHEDRKTEPLVIASTTGEASEILQGLAEQEDILVAQTPSVVAPKITEPAVEPKTDSTSEPAPLEPAPEAPASADASTQAPVPEPITAQTSIVQPTIDAIEIDGKRNFFAGAGAEKSPIRLYVENTLVDTTAVADGRWLVEANDVLKLSTQLVRVDMLSSSGEVVARAEVNFVIDAKAPAVATAEAQSNTPSTPLTETPASSDSQTIAPVTPEVPTIVANSDGGVLPAGSVIIRRGDNLWTIASRVYGDGFRYTQIFKANAEQIANPDLIYPGQVFGLPESDVVLGQEEN